MRRARFAPRVPCAVDPMAFGLFFDLPPPPVVEMRGDIAVVSVRGCLMHHEDPAFDSYDSIKQRVVSCLMGESKPRAIVLALDSPGGVVSGAFDTADEIRAKCADAGVPLYTVGAVLGHKSAASTKRYSHHATASLRAAIGRIGKAA